MANHPVICPTVTAFNTTEYRQQLERIQNFVHRIHIDFMDGVFTPTKSPPVSKAWWQPGPAVDLHVMYKKPLHELERLVRLQPHLIVIHAEAEGVEEFLNELGGLGIKKGLALLQDTTVESIEKYLPRLDHVLIFSGSLGKFGGKVEPHLLQKITKIKRLFPDIEIGWDGGINADNAAGLIAGGVDVLNVGGYIQKAKDPEGAYDKLLQVIDGGN